MARKTSSAVSASPRKSKSELASQLPPLVGVIWSRVHDRKQPAVIITT